MADSDLGAVTTTDLNGTITDYSVTAMTPDSAQNNQEFRWTNPHYETWFGMYKLTPEYKAAINDYATWVLGKGWSAIGIDVAVLEGITGWGEDTFTSVMWNAIVMKKVMGDSYTQIIRNPKTGTLINLKPLGNMTTVTDKAGIIIRYEQSARVTTDPPKTFRPDEIFHLVNDRVADEAHGTSITEGIRYLIETLNEGIRDKRRVNKRATIRIMEVDTNDTATHNNLKSQWSNAIENGEVMILPKGDTSFPVVPDNHLDPLEFLRYIEDLIYQSIGVPKVILGGSSPSEGDAKVSFLSFEPVYVREIQDLIDDLWNQVAIRVTFSPPVSLKDKVQQDEAANTSQTGFQANDTEAGVGE